MTLAELGFLSISQKSSLASPLQLQADMRSSEGARKRVLLLGSGPKKDYCPRDPAEMGMSCQQQMNSCVDGKGKEYLAAGEGQQKIQ